jgi:transcriptional regulator with XRE-family HTH domain
MLRGMKTRNQMDAVRLKQMREEMGLTQAALAARVYGGQGGLNQSAVAHVERGSGGFRAETLGEVADVLNTSMDYLMGRTNDPTPYGELEDQIILVEKDPERREMIQQLFSALQRLPDELREKYLESMLLLYSGVVAQANNSFRLDRPQKQE